MKSHTNKPKATRGSSTSFQKFYDEISQDWQGRANRLQARRWDKLNSHGF